jgi:hypothetical protein
MQVDLVVIDARALNLWPAHDPITPLPSPRIKVSCRDETCGYAEVLMASTPFGWEPVNSAA